MKSKSGWRFHVDPKDGKMNHALVDIKQPLLLLGCNAQLNTCPRSHVAGWTFSASFVKSFWLSKKHCSLLQLLVSKQLLVEIWHVGSWLVEDHHFWSWFKTKHHFSPRNSTIFEPSKPISHFGWCLTQKHVAYVSRTTAKSTLCACYLFLEICLLFSPIWKLAFSATQATIYVKSI